LARAQQHSVPKFSAFFQILSAKIKPNLGLLARLQELADYGFFDSAGERASLLEEKRPTIVRIHGTTNSMLQNAFSSFVLYSLYKDMFHRGVQSQLTHAVIFDEAHRPARLKLIPQFGKECRKFGLALALASQEAKDFDPSLFAAVGISLKLQLRGWRHTASRACELLATAQSSQPPRSYATACPQLAKADAHSVEGPMASDPMSRLQSARDEIDRVLGPGYAQARPEVVVAVMQSAASDYAALAIARAIQDVALALAELEESGRPESMSIVRAHGVMRP
jgi:hypothetical protein